jgi:hypothetical protein
MPISTRASTSANCSAFGIATGSMSADRAMSPRPGLLHLRARRPENSFGARRSGRAAGISQYLPPPRRGVVPRERRRAALRRHHLPLPRLDLQPAGRALAHLVQGSPQRIRCRRLSLVQDQVKEWSGFIFVALTENPPPFEKIFDLPLDAPRRVALERSHRRSRPGEDVQSNWKIFWENYNECLHCPGVHPQLSSLVPIYGRGLLEERDDPNGPNMRRIPIPSTRGACARAPRPGRWTAS